MDNVLKEITNYNGQRSVKVGKFNERHVQNSAQNNPQSAHRNAATISKNQSAIQPNKPVQLNLKSWDFPSPPSVAPPQPSSNVAVLVAKGNASSLGKMTRSTNTNLDILSMEMTTNLLKNQPDWQKYRVETSLLQKVPDKESKTSGSNQVTINTDHNITAPLPACSSSKIKPVTIYLEKVQLLDEYRGEMSLDPNGFAPPLCSTPIQLHSPTAVPDNVTTTSRQQQDVVSLCKRQNEHSKKSQSDSMRQRKRKRQRICLHSKTPQNNGSFKTNKPARNIYSITRTLEKWTKAKNSQLTLCHKRNKGIPEQHSYAMEILAKAERQHKTSKPRTNWLPINDTIIPLCPLLEGDGVNYTVMIDNQSVTNSDNISLDQLLSL